MTCKSSRACSKQSRSQNWPLRSSHFSSLPTAPSSKPEPIQPPAQSPALCPSRIAAGLSLQPTHSVSWGGWAIKFSMCCSAQPGLEKNHVFPEVQAGDAGVAGEGDGNQSLPGSPVKFRWPSQPSLTQPCSCFRPFSPQPPLGLPRMGFGYLPLAGVSTPKSPPESRWGTAPPCGRCRP